MRANVIPDPSAWGPLEVAIPLNCGANSAKSPSSDWSKAEPPAVIMTAPAGKMVVSDDETF
jgi:hypothetical protein